MSEVPAPQEERAVTPVDVRPPRRWAAMRARAERLRWFTVARRKRSRAIRLWIPVTPFLVLFSPLILLVLGVAIFLPRPLGVNPAHVMVGVGRFLGALSGTEVDIEREDRAFQIRLF